jgi:hypothetical protein
VHRGTIFRHKYHVLYVFGTLVVPKNQGEIYGRCRGAAEGGFQRSRWQKLDVNPDQSKMLKNGWITIETVTRPKEFGRSHSVARSGQESLAQG